MLANIRYKMRLLRSVISRTSIAEVNGARVIPVRNAAIPTSIITFVSDEFKSNQPERTEPMLPPQLSPGAKIPPDAPVVNENTEPKILNNGIYQPEYLTFVNKVDTINDFPEPNMLSFTK